MKKTIFLVAVLLLLFVSGCAPEKAVTGGQTPAPQTSGNQNTETTSFTDSAVSEAPVSQESSVSEKATSNGAVSSDTASKKEDFSSNNKTETPDAAPAPDKSETDPIINSSAPQRISREDAKKIALDHAGLAEANVYDFEIDLDMEAGILTYEISFNSNRTEYDYDIKASDGTIINSHKEFDD